MTQDIIKKIQELKKTGPSSEWVALNRDILLKKIKLGTYSEKASIGVFDYSQLLFNIFRQRLLQPATAMIMMFVMFVGGSLVVNAAFYSLPGEPLYKVKIALEKTQVALTAGADKQVDLKIEFAKNRVNELDKIVQQTSSTQEKRDRVNAVVGQFKKNVIAVKEHIEKISKDEVSAADKEMTLKIALTISEETEELAKELGQKVEALPDQDKTEIQKIVSEAVTSAEQTSLIAKEIINKEDSAKPTGTVEGASTETEAINTNSSQENLNINTNTSIDQNTVKPETK